MSSFFGTLIRPQAAQTLFVIYIRDSIALCFEPFKRMYENGGWSCPCVILKFLWQLSRSKVVLKPF